MSLISFTAITDGSTATASSVNTPLSTIYNDYNGNITDANVASNAAIAGSKIAVSSLAFGATVQSQANAGTAGGTMKYINLGGIKMLWCISANQNTGSSSINYTFTLPSSFFSTITSVSVNAINMTTDNRQNVAVAATPSTTTITVAAWYPLGGSATVGINLFVIGT